jgi:hypothetical protein
VASYQAASGEGNGVDLTTGIGDIPLAGEKHLSVAVNASMAAGWGLSCATNGEKRRRTKRRCDCVFLCLFIVFIPSFCGAVKSISEDSSEIEHRRLSKNGRFLWGFLRLPRLLFTLPVGFITGRWLVMLFFLFTSLPGLIGRRV